MGGRHAIGIEALAAGGAPAMEAGPVPGGGAALKGFARLDIRCEMDPVAAGSFEAVVLQAAMKRSGTIADARVRIFFKDSLPFRFAWK